MTLPLTPTTWQSTASPISNDPNVFPAFPGAGLWAKKKPNWNVQRRRSVSNRQVRSTQQTVPIWDFEVGYELIRDRTTLPELNQLYGFLCNALGGAASFFLYDPCDNTVTDQAVGTGDNTTATFQLGRTWNAGGTYAFYEPIYCVRGTPTVKVAGVTSSFYTVGTQGQITFSGGHIPTAGQAITWSGSYLFWVHFADDVEPEQAFSDLWALKSLRLESDKP